MDSKKAFTAFDKNNDGKISKTELDAAFKKMNIIVSQEELNQIMNYIDKSGDGHIDVKEFLEVLNIKWFIILFGFPQEVLSTKFSYNIKFIKDYNKKILNQFYCILSWLKLGESKNFSS